MTTLAAHMYPIAKVNLDQHAREDLMLMVQIPVALTALAVLAFIA